MNPDHPHIEGVALTPEHIGKRVLFVPPYDPAAVESGIISSWRECGAIFVRFRSTSGQRCPAEWLKWAPELEDGQQ